MKRLLVTANKLNKRSRIPSGLPDPNGISGVVMKGYTFDGTEVINVPNPALGKWYQDRDQNFYWGGALTVLEDIPDVDEEANVLKTADADKGIITPLIKKKIEQVVNVFETGSAKGNYAELVKYKDYTDPVTKQLMIQITYGRSQTTEFGHLKELLQDYVNVNGMFANDVRPYLPRLGKQPSLAGENDFCDALIRAGKQDPVMKKCQDDLFDVKYYQPAYQWFLDNGFTLPLSMLVIYDSRIHSGGILSFLRKRFPTNVPVHGGDEKEWIGNYVDVRGKWLAAHSNPILRSTTYRTSCFNKQMEAENWDLSGQISANGILIS
jgi:chitosanase